jgi:hypothetical protein
MDTPPRFTGRFRDCAEAWATIAPLVAAETRLVGFDIRGVLLIAVREAPTKARAIALSAEILRAVESLDGINLKRVVVRAVGRDVWNRL